MKGKLFYIPKFSKLVYCHDYLFGSMTLGGMRPFSDDARTNIFRQKISKDIFMRFEPIELDLNRLDRYEFLYLPDWTKSLAVKTESEPRTYLPGATVLESLSVEGSGSILSRLHKNGDAVLYNI